MEYLLDQIELESAAEVLRDISVDKLEEEIERLRSNFYKIQFGNYIETDLDSLARQAYLLATLVSGPLSPYSSQTKSKALGVAALIFEFLSELSGKSEEKLNCALNAILFYSRGEQEAQSATLARKLRQNEIRNYLAFDADIREAWDKILLFLGREFQPLLRWGRDSFQEYSLRIDDSFDGSYWFNMLQGCINTANTLVCGESKGHDFFNKALHEARTWGDSRLIWFAHTIKEIAEKMLERSLLLRLTEIGLPKWATETLTMSSIFELWLPHREAFKSSQKLEKGILSDNAQISLVNMPTSAGKSLIAEIAILFELIKDPSAKAIWVVPSRALVFEVLNKLSSHLRRIGINVSSLPGGLEFDPEDADNLLSARVFILTPEKLDGLLRRNIDFFKIVKIIVIDEMHKIGEEGRGWLLESIIAWLLLIAENYSDLRLLFISAILPNRPEFESWLGKSESRFASKWVTWRPTRLALFTTEPESYRWVTKLIQKKTQEIIIKHKELPYKVENILVPIFLLSLLSEKEHKRTLVFFYTKEDVENFAARLSSFIKEPLSLSEALTVLLKKFESIYGTDHPFSICIRRGIGINHGDIPQPLRRLVEGYFRSGDLPILVANQTILEGVNFPIEDMIIGSLGSGSGKHFRFRLRVQDFENLIGRAGRALVDTEGRCFLIWNWFYQNESYIWDSYVQPTSKVEGIQSTFSKNEKDLVKALNSLIVPEGIDEGALEKLSTNWREKLERLHSVALTLLDQNKATTYAILNYWIQKTFAWQSLNDSTREILEKYNKHALIGFKNADKELYRLASLSGLSVNSARIIRTIANEIISEGRALQLDFASLINRKQFGAILGLRECWGQHPVKYSFGKYIPKIDHYTATISWINGESWSEVARIICEMHQNLAERTRSNLVASYISQIFEYRLPWVLGALALAIKDLNGKEELQDFFTILPSFVRYGLNFQEAVTISKICNTEREVSLILAKKYFEKKININLIEWLQRRSRIELTEWLPGEPEKIIEDLFIRINKIRKRNWTLRKNGFALVELSGWENYKWNEIKKAFKDGLKINLILRLEPNNPYDIFSVAVDALFEKERLHIGYIPSSHSEDVFELTNWGRNVSAEIKQISPPKIHLKVIGS